jgi:hypothetical protein
MIILSMIIILGTALSGIALNASKQVNKDNEHNKGINLAEMGVTYYLSVNKNLIQTVQNEVVANPNNFCSQFSSGLAGQSFYDMPQTVDGRNKYKIHFDRITPSCTSNPSELVIEFHSIGILENGKEVPIKGLFKVQKTDTTGSQVPILTLDINNPVINNSTDVWVYEDPQKIKKMYPDTINSNAWFNDTLSLIGNAPLTITRDAVFDKNIEFNSHTNLTIKGDAFFRSLNPITKTDANARLCIQGKSYYLDTNLQLHDFPNILDVINGLRTNYLATLNTYPSILVDLGITIDDLLMPKNNFFDNLTKSINNLTTINQCQNSNINNWIIDPQNGIVIDYNLAN